MRMRTYIYCISYDLLLTQLVIQHDRYDNFNYPWNCTFLTALHAGHCECSGCALSVALCGQHLHTAHCTDPFFVGARLAVVRTHLVNFLLRKTFVMYIE